MTRLQTCRLCGKTNYDTGEPLFAYSTRHNVHASCAFDRWGERFLTMLTVWQVERLPFGVLRDKGMYDTVMAFLSSRRTA